MRHKGFVELLLLLFLVVIALKIYIIYRAWNLIEEKARADMHLQQKATPTEVIGAEIEKLKEQK